jgi:hypothetical protein
LPDGGDGSLGIGVVNIGSSTTVASGKITITVGAGGVPAGAQIVVCGADNGSLSNQSVADSAVNTYLQSSIINNTGLSIYIMRERTGKALTNGQTIVLTLNSDATLGAANAFYATGLRNIGADGAVTNTNSATSTTPTVTSGVPSAKGELFVGIVGSATLTSSFTQDSTNAAWATPPGQVSLAAPVLVGGDVINSGNGALTYAPTLDGGAHVWAATIVGFLAETIDMNSQSIMMLP